MSIRPCVVTFTDTDGIRHSAEVQAGTLYEAAVLALKAFQDHGCSPGAGAHLDVKVSGPSVTHTLTVRKVRDWLNGTCKGPSEKVKKEELKALLK